jgi:hypothetical protein
VNGLVSMFMDRLRAWFENLPNQPPDYFSEGRWTSKFLTSALHRPRGKKVPDQTLRRWRRELGIIPDTRHRYTDFDLESLRWLATWLKTGGLVEEFRVEYKAGIQRLKAMGQGDQDV